MVPRNSSLLKGPETAVTKTWSTHARTHKQVWELALADGRASDVYEIIARADEGGGGSGSSTTTMHAAHDIERRLRVMKSEKEAGGAPPAATESQLIVMRNFYSRYGSG